MITGDATLTAELLEQVLLRLGFSKCPEATPEALCDLYAAWCQRVPFDNVRKLIYVRNENSGPLPGSTAADFFEAWLKHGTGGTCWAGAGACQALLSALGFDAQRGVGTMLVTSDVPPNHGTVTVLFGDERYLVDCSVLHGEPLLLDATTETQVEHPAWGVTCATRDGRWHVKWRPLHKVDGFECRLERFGVGRHEFENNYDNTRPWSPFNYELSARLNKVDKVVGAGFGQIVSLLSDGSITSLSATREERVRLLIEEMGMSDEIVRQLPEDVKTPPPPWSKTAAMADSVKD